MINFESPHRRFNALTGEWVLVSPHRTKRPWLGKQEVPLLGSKIEYDPDCYLCQGNVRANGQVNPDYQDTFVFTNDFPALLPENEGDSCDEKFFQSKAVKGTSRVICFSPNHSLSLAEMEIPSIEKVVEIWVDQYLALGEQYRWVQVFENKGAAMGASSPHPHGQVWASDQIPNEPQKEDVQQRNYFSEHNRPLLLEYLEAELEHEERIVEENAHWVVLVPFWAIWPYEVLLIPRRHILRLPEMTPDERNGLAVISKKLLTRYDNLFKTSFPYSMGWHNAPNLIAGESTADQYGYWQLHAHYYPPLLRSAKVKKFLVGYEMLAEAQRDITAEQAAKTLRELPEPHYRKRI